MEKEGEMGDFKKDLERRRRCWDPSWSTEIICGVQNKLASVRAGGLPVLSLSLLCSGVTQYKAPEVPTGVLPGMCPCQGLQGWEGDSHLLERKEEEGIGIPPAAPWLSAQGTFLATLGGESLQEMVLYTRSCWHGDSGMSLMSLMSLCPVLVTAD